MKHILWIALFNFAPLAARADQYDVLREHAKQVPTAAIDQEVIGLIANETNESAEGMRSHYTLALFEDAETKRSWYILDGYYELRSGKLLFLDFEYSPATKAWAAIENYKFYQPALNERFLLEAQEACNPYKRHYIGLLRAQTAQLPTVTSFFQERHGRQPIYLLVEGLLIVIDPTKSTSARGDVMFTLQERDAITSLGEKGTQAGLFPSGRRPSTPDKKQTYVGVSGSCLQL